MVHALPCRHPSALPQPMSAPESLLAGLQRCAKQLPPLVVALSIGFTDSHCGEVDSQSSASVLSIVAAAAASDRRRSISLRAVLGGFINRFPTTPPTAS
jgi:hypothetical protein